MNILPPVKFGSIELLMVPYVEPYKAYCSPEAYAFIAGMAVAHGPEKRVAMTRMDFIGFVSQYSMLDVNAKVEFLNDIFGEEKDDLQTRNP